MAVSTKCLIVALLLLGVALPAAQAGVCGGHGTLNTDGTACICDDHFEHAEDPDDPLMCVEHDHEHDHGHDDEHAEFDCGEHGVAHDDHCDCEPGYVQVELKCVAAGR